MAGRYWPYRRTALDFKVRAQSSGGFEGLAISPDGTRLYPLLEKLLDGVGSTIIASEFDLATKQYTGKRFTYQFEAKGVSIGEFILFEENKGLIIERDNTQGDLNGLKRVYQVKLPKRGGAMEKQLVQDLLKIPDPSRLTPGTGLPGDVGLAIVNDNNYPFSIGRHVGAKLSDDNELIFVKLPKKLY